MPSTVYDDSLNTLLLQLREAEPDGAEGLRVDFQDVRFYVPAALVALLGTVNHWMAAGRRVEFINLEACECRLYLQRMDFFALCGVPLPEAFRRHDPSGRFVPLRRIDASLRGQVDRVCAELAACIFPELADSDDPETAGPFEMVQYAASELINTVIQHANGPGFVAAQVYPHSGFIRLAVADTGIGIRGSFEETKPAFWHPQMSHLDSIRTALQPKISSKMHLASGWAGDPRRPEGLYLATIGRGLFRFVPAEKTAAGSP